MRIICRFTSLIHITSLIQVSTSYHQRSQSIAFLSGITARSSKSTLSNPTCTTLDSSSETAQSKMTKEEDTETNPLTQHSLPSPLLLGSSSFTRKLILREMKIPFHILVRSIDEKAIGDRATDTPHDLVLAVARAKMDRLIHALTNKECDNELPTTNTGEYVILTGDQVITCNNTILEKPQDIKQAKEFVQMYANYAPSTVGSVILTHYPTGITVEGTDTATIHFKNSVGQIDGITHLDLVDRMLLEGAPVLSCAGGLMIEHPLVREHVENIEGTEDSVMGLSKALVERLLGELRTKLDEIV